MASKSRTIPPLNNGQNISSGFVSISAYNKEVTFWIDLGIFHVGLAPKYIKKDWFSLFWPISTFMMHIGEKKEYKGTCYNNYETV